MFRGFVSVLALTVATAASAAEQANPAHAIAQKFAAPTETAAPAKSAPTKALPAKGDAAKPATTTGEASKADRAKTDAASTERPPLDYEMEMLRRARAEQTAITPAKVAATPVTAAAPQPAVPPPAATPSPAAAPFAAAPADVAPAVTIPVAVVPAVPSPAAAPAVATPIMAPVTAAVAVPAATAVLPTKTAEAAPPPPLPTAPAPNLKASDFKASEVTTAVEAKPAEPARPAVAAPGPATPATLLLALETHSSTTKGGAAAVSFDPIVCLNENCFISGGLQADAIKIAKTDAIKLKTTEDASPASCKGMIACIFRNVAVPTGAQLQVIELGSASHDAARASDLKLDNTCRVNEGELACDEPIATPDFKIWVVPEETARAAGVQAIEEAVADGLPHVDVARASDK